jgi:hypothetical protein
MRSFDQLLSLLSNIPDPRRAEGKLYKLQHVRVGHQFRAARGTVVANAYRGSLRHHA